MLVWPPKDADEIIDYPVDWSDRLGADIISSATFTVVSGDVTISASEHDSDKLSQATISGGTTGTKAKVLCEVDTLNGQQLQQTATILIRAR